jgi:hypothetical protein
MQRVIFKDFRFLELDTVWAEHILAQFERRLCERRENLG